MPYRRFLLAVMTALFVARPLVPSEAVAWLGDGQPFCMLWLLLAVLTLAACWRQGLVRPIGAIDIALAALIGWHSVSAVWAVVHGSPRPALNMLWEWISLGVAYFLVRQLVATPRETRALVAVMIALAVVMSLYGLEQSFFSLPAQRAEYRQNPDALLREVGAWSPPGSPERKIFEDRLRSPEPLATFALTNSLAGFLAPWLIITLGIAWSAWTKRTVGIDESRAIAVRFVAMALVIATCLLLTRSRSGYVACAVGLLAIPFCCGAGSRVNWKLVGAIGVAVLVLAGGALAALGWQDELIGNAARSLAFRFQYWQSCWGMIEEHPWLGCGPGNFQDVYTQYKLPEASEEVRDPHNLFVEVWATAGTPALLALVAVLGLFAWRTLREREEMPAAVGLHAHREPKKTHSRKHAAREPANETVAVLLGAVLGPILAYLIAPLAGLDFSGEKLLGGLFLGAIVIGLSHAWIHSGDLPRRLLALGVLVLSINLLAAGGIGYPGVAGTLWMLMGLAAPQAHVAEVDSGRNRQGLSNGTDRTYKTYLSYSSCLRGLVSTRVGLVVACSLGMACYLTGYNPVVRCTTFLSKAEGAALAGDGATQQQTLLAAAFVDPWSAEPWRESAALHLAVWKKQKDRQGLHELQEAISHAVRLRPRSSLILGDAAEWCRYVARETHDEYWLKRTEELYRRAIACYPTSARLHANFALALAELDNPQAAQLEACEALRLDELMPHLEKKLPDSLRTRAAQLAAD